MSLIIADRVKETTTTAGASNITLLGPVAGHRTFASVPAVAVNDTCYYCIDGGASGEWETGLGKILSFAPTVIQRTTVTASSNAGAAVVLSAGTKEVFITLTSAAILRTGSFPLYDVTLTSFGTSIALNFPALPMGRYRLSMLLAWASNTGVDILFNNAAATYNMTMVGHSSTAYALTKNISGLPTFSSGSGYSTALALDMDLNVQGNNIYFHSTHSYFDGSTGYYRVQTIGGSFTNNVPLQSINIVASQGGFNTGSFAKLFAK